MCPWVQGALWFIFLSFFHGLEKVFHDRAGYLGRLKTLLSSEPLGLSEEGHSKLPSQCLLTQDICYPNPLWSQPTCFFISDMTGLGHLPTYSDSC